MSHASAVTSERVAALANPATRAEAAQALAEHLGVAAFLLMVRDPALGKLMPAPGFPQTLRGGARWWEFVKLCGDKRGRHAQEVDFPRGERHPAVAVTGEDLCAILVGGTPRQEAVDDVVRLLPLLSALLGAEQRALLAGAESAQARGAAVRAQALADALEEARVEGSRLNARLSEQHRMKDDFLAMLAHELRNPLTPLVVSIELLRRLGPEGDAGKRQLDVMARQVRQLSRLVEDLLDVARVSRGRIELRPQQLALNEVIADAVDATRPLMDARRNVVTVRPAPESLWVDGDAVRLAQVFANLLHNAVKFTHPGGRIEVTSEREGDEAVVRLRDDGVGMDEQTLPSIFELFSQAPVSLARAKGGLGIGLTLVRSLVELHGGSVGAASEGRGRGSTFTIRLPLAPAGPARPEAASPPPEAAAHETTPSSLRILVVDDNQDAAETLAEVMRLSGHHSRATFSGTEAIAVAPDFDPDLVLLDIGLPELDGYEVARRLRRVLAREVRIVAITGYGTPEDKRLAREAGFDEHLVKPVMPDAIAEVAARARHARHGHAPALSGATGSR